MNRDRRTVHLVLTAGLLVCATSCSLLPGAGAPGNPGGDSAEDRSYPWHTDIVATVFWVGEIHDPTASDGSQEISTYDSNWMANYGGCDGVIVEGSCETEPRVASNGYFPSSMTPKQNPFYLDLPFDDVNDEDAFEMREEVIPWAEDPGYAGKADDRTFSYMKNRWVRMEKDGSTCYGQIQDAGPGVYDDAEYVFGTLDQRPANTRFNGAGMDVSPALAGCLQFEQLNGAQARVDWKFVEESEVPDGPWKILVTTAGVVPFEGR
ncbi:hypothetical protein BJ994_001725 [Arthrobacter pigmenti]|uniref:Lipoprotein n=1 Tax=Arthrobacter pigmenti TaxID=271432 RepID=A0A846RNI8_9MICC|nr:hypothetical protein [Arthrobacter pigmenti]NJC22649.1 hypothetical protein [Arthrobacter pigmenti]